MQGDLISRSELLKLFPLDMRNPLWHFTGIRAAIEAAPAVDAVPVVRCRDCCYVAKDGESLYCTYHDNNNVTEEFFCAAGEVKDAQTNRPDGQHDRQGTDGD